MDCFFNVYTVKTVIDQKLGAAFATLNRSLARVPDVRWHVCISLFYCENS
jgi:hypothetical protein